MLDTSNDGSAIADPSELRAAALQLLQHYHRCGVRQLFHASLDIETVERLKAMLHIELQGSIASVRDRASSADEVTDQLMASRFAQARSHGSGPAISRAPELSNTGSSQRQAAAGVTEGPIEPTLPTRIPSSFNSNDESNMPRKKPSTSPVTTTSHWELPVLDAGERESQFGTLKRKVSACTKCPELVAYRSRTVFGRGSLTPTVCFFGEAPGADEDKQGVPFVGKAGQLLDKIIEAAQIKPEQFYILNALRCRPPQNRTPTPEEVENCRPFFEAQLETLQPKFIVCLGAVAVRAILQTNESVGALRGRLHNYRGAKVLVTYHPAYLLRNPPAKKFVWEDMQILMKELGIKIPKGTA